MRVFDVQGIAESLYQIQHEGGEGNFVIFHADIQCNKYIQFAGAKGSSSLYGEAVGNEYLAAEDALGAEEIGRLHELGWKGQGGSFWQRLDVNNSENRLALAHEVLEALASVYGLSGGQAIEVTLALE